MQRQSEGTAPHSAKPITPEEQARVRQRFQEKAERDRIARLNSARQAGHVEGREEEKRAIAQNMLGSFDDETISAMTGLPLAEVAALRAQKAVSKQA